jgi:lipopolysaccharide biosynthesis regulator YciM
MVDYVLSLLVLFFGALAFYLVYDRFMNRPKSSESSTYSDALRDLLDGRQETAYTKLRQVVADDPGNVDAYLRMGQILRENNQPARALQIHKDLTLRAGLTRPQKVAILRQLASDYIATDDLVTAEAALKEIRSLDSGNYWAHTQMLSIQEKAQQWEQASETAEQILKLEGNRSKKPLARYGVARGDQLYRQKEYHKARIAYKEAISLDPTCVQAYLSIGDSYAEEQRYEDAVTFWTKLITAVPEQAHMVIDRLKTTLFELGRYGDIADICQEILAHAPGNATARRTLAEFHQRKGDSEMAIAMLEQLVDDHSDDRAAILDLVRLYHEKGDRKKLSDLIRTLERKRSQVKGSGTDRAVSTPTPIRA